MDQTEITRLTRNGLRDLRYSSSDITSMTLQGVLQFGKKIKACAPSFYRERMILTSNTHVFDWPSDCESVFNVYDTLTNSVAITDATNASPINIEAVGHGLSEDNIVLVTGVLGNTAANGTFKVAYVDADNVTLDGSTGNAAYTSGGQIIQWSSSFMKMRKKDPRDQDLQSRYKWYSQGAKIVVDYIDFTNDILIDYSKRPSAITDIPAEYHMGLVGWNVMMLMEIPDPESPEYADKVSSARAHRGMYNAAKSSIQDTMEPTTEPSRFPDSAGWGAM